MAFFIRMAMSPVPVILLFLLVGLGKLVILLVVFFEVPLPSLILFIIPFVRIMVSSIFVVPDLLPAVSLLRPSSCCED